MWNRMVDHSPDQIRIPRNVKICKQINLFIYLKYVLLIKKKKLVNPKNEWGYLKIKKK